MTSPRSCEEVVDECERLNAAEPFIEHTPSEDGKGGWIIASSLRPDWQRFSKSDRLDRPVCRGERFAVRDDVEVKVATHWNAPFTGGHAATLPGGTIVVAADDQVPGFPGFACVPEDYEGLEAVLVPEADREVETYSGYSLSFTLEDIGSKLFPLDADEGYEEAAP